MLQLQRPLCPELTFRLAHDISPDYYPSDDSDDSDTVLQKEKFLFECLNQASTNINNNNSITHLTQTLSCDKTENITETFTKLKWKEEQLERINNEINKNHLTKEDHNNHINLINNNYLQSPLSSPDSWEQDHSRSASHSSCHGNKTPRRPRKLPDLPKKASPAQATVQGPSAPNEKCLADELQEALIKSIHQTDSDDDVFLPESKPTPKIYPKFSCKFLEELVQIKFNSVSKNTRAYLDSDNFYLREDSSDMVVRKREPSTSSDISSKRDSLTFDITARKREPSTSSDTSSKRDSLTFDITAKKREPSTSSDTSSKRDSLTFDIAARKREPSTPDITARKREPSTSSETTPGTREPSTSSEITSRTRESSSSLDITAAKGESSVSSAVVRKRELPMASGSGGREDEAAGCSYQDLEVTHRGMHRFIPRHADEMAIEIGDPLHVIKTGDDLWCEGVNLRSYQKGIFPSMYATDLEFLEEEEGTDEDGCRKFYLRFLGSVEVNYHKGDEVLCQAINKVALSRRAAKSSNPPPVCTLELSQYGIRMFDKSKTGHENLDTYTHFFALKNISFCGYHPRNERYFAFITKHPNQYRYACHVFLGEKSTRSVSEALGQAFKRFYQEYMAFTHLTEDIYME